jgi:nitroimidazol reductase NimA-like FMN-containing flavoprotein (pyridoxamine 5'-phosphate oxidase superfamily)
MTRVNLRARKIAYFLTKGKPKLLRLAIVDKKGAVHVSATWYLWKDGLFYLSTSEDRLKVRAIRDNPNVALIVDTDVIPYEGVIVEGTATLSKEDVGPITLAIVKKYVPLKYVKSQYEDLMRYPRILVKIKPKKSIDIMSFKHLK